MADELSADIRKTMLEDRHESSESTPYGYLLMATLCIATGIIRLSMAGQEVKEDMKPETPLKAVQTLSDAK